MVGPRKPLEPFRNHGHTVGIRWTRFPLTADGWLALAIACATFALVFLGAAQIG